MAEDDIAAEDQASATFRQIGRNARQPIGAMRGAAACRLMMLTTEELSQAGADADAAVRWQWRPSSRSSCDIAVWGGLGDGCKCLLGLATLGLRQALADGGEPDIAAINEMVVLALGPGRPAVVRLRMPACPNWLPCLH
jgi:hypothetical protein